MTHIGSASRWTLRVLMVILFAIRTSGLTADPFDRQASETLQQQIHQQAHDFLQSHRLVGLSIGIVNGKTSFTLNLGEVQVGSDIEPTSATIYEIGSVSKTFTAVILADDVLKGNLQLEQPVQDLLPEGQRVPRYGKHPIRLIDLATHTSGLPRIPAGMVFSLMIPGVASNPYKSYDDEYLYDYLTSSTIWRQPGKKYEYSNLGAGLLGFALARFHRSTYDDMVSRIICDRLDMADTTVKLSVGQLSRLAPGHKDGADGAPVETPNWEFQDAYAGAGGLKSTVRDMMKYLAANLGHTTGSIARACSFTHTTRFADGSTTMGLCWHKLPNPSESETLIHDGGTGGYSSVILFNVRQQIGVVILSNKFDGSIGRLGMDLLQTVQARSKSFINSL